MGPSPQRVLDPESITKAAVAFFEPQLASMKLTVADIETQSLEELQASLQRVNEAIQNAPAFGVMRINVTAEAGVVIARSQTQSTMEIGILPILLDRKTLILRRIALLKPQEQLSNLKETVETTVLDEKARAILLQAIDESGAEAKEQAYILDRQAQQTEEQRAKSLRLQMELSERKSAIYQSFLQRESVASIVGALLLVALGAALIVSMFTHTAVTEVIRDSFLLILGYFFGQATSRAASASKSATPAE